MPEATVVVFGASGFVGRAVCAALEARGATVQREPAPRLSSSVRWDAGQPDGASDEVRTLAQRLPAAATVVNAAGISDSGHSDEAALMAANARLPGLLAAAAAATGARFVHVSSAAVQGRVRQLDSSLAVDPFSTYSRSKAAGERAALAGNARTVCYRPPGVHAPDRRVTRSLARIARSRVSSTAAPGTANTAQALLENVADACAHLALCADDPPAVVAHPSEHLTTSELLRLLGGREPILSPRPLALAVVAIARAGGRMSPRLAANARRLEMLWLGQAQHDSWLTLSGWTPPREHSRWAEIGRLLASPDTDEENT